MYKKIFSFLIVFMFLVSCQTTPTKEVETEAESVVEVEVPDRVHFALDSYELSMKAKVVLGLQAEWLKQDTEIDIIIEGHCDERGTDAYNMYLGEKRAEAVKNYLVGKGVSARRIETVSYGRERPVYKGRGESVWKKNRRAVIVIDD